MMLNLLSMLPFIPMLAIVIYRRKMDEIDIGLLIVFVAGAIFGLAWQHRRHSRIKCPQCKTTLYSDHGKLAPGDPINSRCEKCDVEWVTGLSVSRGD